MKTTASSIIRWAGLAAMGSGILFIAIQAVHPLDVLSSLTTTQWTIAHTMGVAMGIFGILGMAGLYARQVEETGWLGLAGFLLLTVFYALTTAFQFVEALITPMLVTTAPDYVEGFLGIASGQASAVNMGALPTVYMLSGFAGYMLGGLLFGIATFRARVLPRWAGVLLAVGVVLPLVGTGLVPHPLDRIFAVPVGLAQAWLGYMLWTEPREHTAQTSHGRASLQLRQTVAK